MKALFRIFAGSTNSRRMIIGLAAVFCLTVPAYGSVTVLWEQYHFYGDAWGYTEIYRQASYSFTDSNPVSVSETYGISSGAWKFGARAFTGGPVGEAGASSTFVFTVDQPLLIIKYAGTLRSFAFPDTWGGTCELTDNLTKKVIGSQKWSLSNSDEKFDPYANYGLGWRKTIEESISYNLVTGHEYKLLLSAEVTNVDGSYADMSAVLVPEPSSLLLL